MKWPSMELEGIKGVEDVMQGQTLLHQHVRLWIISSKQFVNPTI
jgi:hypothetical protein